MWHTPPGASSFTEADPESAQSLFASASAYGSATFDPMSSAELKAWLCCVRFVTVMVRVTVPLTELTMPKSSSFGEKAIGAGTVPAASAGSAWVCVVALVACAVMVPGPLPVSAMLHSPPVARVVPQSVAKVNPGVEICRPDPAVVLRLRRVRLGESSVESASDAVATPAGGMVSFARYAAEPAHRLPLQADTGSTAARTLDGNALVGALVSGRSKVCVASRLWLAYGAKLPPATAFPVASTAMLVSAAGAPALPGFEAATPPKRAA